ncbi:Uncharacterized protein TCM_013236 [Theobroma cacao]|uniref:DUF4283 domain-containing protein n=1 Tax=Theobroma cacao TaxID=3641 RepID=A0A061FWT0_THECC|nr:Uncharacterized protein TCM_013236 [Theobroma cacao]
MCMYEKSALLLIAKTIGKPLYIDEATATRSRPSVARVCVEYDCRKDPVEQVWIVVKDRVSGTVTGCYMQRVEFSKIPEYCGHCCHVGHAVSTCLVLGNRPANLEKAQVSKTLREDKRKTTKGEADPRQKQKKGKEQMLPVQTKQSEQWQPIGKPEGSETKEATGQKSEGKNLGQG